MAKTVDISGTPMRVVRYVVASTITLSALAFVAVIAGFITGDSTRFLFPDGGGVVFITAFIALWQGVTVALLWRVRGADADWWGPVPREQYLGRFAGHGGLARHSWERAVDQLPDDDEED